MFALESIQSFETLKVSHHLEAGELENAIA
jgi:hypothetical protein